MNRTDLKTERAVLVWSYPWSAKAENQEVSR
jgi:hypothetical protein